MSDHDCACTHAWGLSRGSGALCSDGREAHWQDPGHQGTSLVCAAGVRSLEKVPLPQATVTLISSAGRGGGCRHTAESQGSCGPNPGVCGGVFGGTCHLRALRVAWPGPNLLGPRCWDTCLCSFCDLSIFSAVVFDFMFCICIRNHWHFWSTSQRE